MSKLSINPTVQSKLSINPAVQDPWELNAFTEFLFENLGQRVRLRNNRLVEVKPAWRDLDYEDGAFIGFKEINDEYDLEWKPNGISKVNENLDIMGLA